MEPESAKAIIKPDLKNDDNKQSPKKSNPPFSPSSSSSSSSSSVSLEFAIDEKDLLYGPNSPDHQHLWSMLSASPPPETVAHLLPELSTGGYDPNRIPTSIFSTKASNPDGWSVASNESLFSIQTGNNSFSQDNAILYGKSGELRRLDECNGSQLSVQGNLSEAKKANNKNNELSGGLPTVIEVHGHEESSMTSGEVSRVESFDSPKVISRMGMENHAKEKKDPGNNGAANAPDFKKGPHHETSLKSSSTPRTSASYNRLSDESGNSSSSFAFPVLVSDGVKTGSSRKVTDTPEKPQLQAQVSNTTEKAPEQGRWFSRFCCWPRCC